jgi:uncharacterized membrane protein YvlD (DUF360 family)
MDMKEETRILRDYYLFTLPQVSVFAGAVLGILFILHLPILLSLGVFSLLYGVLLLIIHAIVYPQFHSNVLYRLGFLGSAIMVVVGLYFLYLAI